MATVVPSFALSPPALAMFGDNSYPTSDGRPMGETDLHRRVMFDVIGALEQHYAGQPVYVSGNLLLFYRPGNKRRHVSPDVLVTKGLQAGLRKNYILWQEASPPHIVIEVTSESTRDEDLQDKFEIYQTEIGVAEYFLFDPYGEYLNPLLQGFRLEAGKYVPIAPANGRLVCEQLGMELDGRQGSLRLFDQRTGLPILPPRELAEEAARQHEQDEQEIERLRLELHRLRKS